MVQVWLVLLGTSLVWHSNDWAKTSKRFPGAAWVAVILAVLGYFCWLLSVILFFYNGGTTG